MKEQFADRLSMPEPTRPWAPPPASVFTGPDDVLHDGRMSLPEKRALLASWVSDVHSVENAPALRRLDSGAIVSVDDILAALRSLDEAQEAARPGTRTRPRLSFARRRAGFMAQLRQIAGRPTGRDDDDDPPPAPAAALLPTRPVFVAALGEPASLPAAA